MSGMGVGVGGNPQTHAVRNGRMSKNSNDYNQEKDHHSTSPESLGPDSMCGLGSWRPAGLQKFSNIKTFTAVLSMWSLFGSVNFAYYSSVIGSIEKEFGLPSSVSGLIKNVDNIGFMATVLIFSHFCRDANKPKLFGIVTVCSSAAIFLFAVPHFIWGHVGRDVKEAVFSNMSAITKPKQDVEFCDGITELPSEEICGAGGGVMRTVNTGALVFFVCSELLQGIAQAPKFPLSLTYMDDNAKDDSPKYFSFMFAMRALSPVLGYTMGAWISTIFVTLKDPGFDQSDPRWVGAWWLGFVICAAGSVIWALPMACFPPVLKDASGSAVDTTNQKEEVSQKLKEFPRAIGRLLKNKMYVILMLGLAFDVYTMGYFTFLPKYFQNQFSTTPAVSSLASGCIASIAIGLGPLLGGQLVTMKKSITPYWSCSIIAGTTFLTIIGYIILMFFGCEEPKWAGTISRDNIDLQLDCNGNCSCDSVTYVPVCGEGVNYFSPCHAGCAASDMINGTKVYIDCGCTGGIATPGLCPRECVMMIPFSVVLFFTQLVSVLDKVPSMTLFMRVAGERDKPLAIALAGMFLMICAFPAPIVYGYILDTACVVFYGGCSKSKTGRGGACALYDNEEVRYWMHGLTIVFKSVAFVFYCIAMWVSKFPEYNKELYTNRGGKESQKDDVIKGDIDEPEKIIASTTNV